MIKLVIFLRIRLAGVQNKTGATVIASSLPLTPCPVEQKWFETGLYCKHYKLQTKGHRP
jgi:hypothetical protein